MTTEIVLMQAGICLIGGFWLGYVAAKWPEVMNK